MAGGGKHRMNMPASDRELQEAMAAYGVTDVIDLRSESEVASSPSPYSTMEPFAMKTTRSAT